MGVTPSSFHEELLLLNLITQEPAKKTPGRMGYGEVTRRTSPYSTLSLLGPPPVLLECKHLGLSRYTDL